MKRTVAVLFALLLMANLFVVCFAEDNVFVSSPSTVQAPELIEGKNETTSCPAEVVITSYADRSKLGVENVIALEAAYNALATTEDLGVLSADIQALAEELKVSSADFAVSDLFDISYSNCDAHMEHGVFSIKLKPASTEGFVAMLHYTESGFEVIEGTVENGTITFDTPSLSPFAIMVHSDLPENPNFALWWLWLLLLLLLIIIIIVVSSKKKAEKKVN